MESNQLKNMIVLKNLQSNIIDEAFIILKNNKKIKLKERIEKKEDGEREKEKKEEYIVKEAEMVINSFMSGIEREKQIKNNAMKLLEKKCKRLKIVSIILGVMLILNTLVNMA